MNYCCAINGSWPQGWRTHMYGICEPVLNYLFFHLDVIQFFDFFFFFGLFVERAPFMSVVNFVSVFYFLKPAEQSTKRRLTCPS